MSQINFPNSPEDGDEFLASNGTTYQYDSSTGQWKIVAGPGVQGPPGNTGPTGSIIMWGTSTLPAGYIECNGQSTSGYSALAALYGSNVPDLRGEFIRGWDNGRGVDTGRNLLSTQGESFKSHTHIQTSHGHTFDGNRRPAFANIVPGPNYGAWEGPNPNGAGVGNATATNQNTGGTETRPRNVALMYIIKT